MMNEDSRRKKKYRFDKMRTVQCAYVIAFGDEVGYPKRSLRTKETISNGNSHLTEVSIELIPI